MLRRNLAHVCRAAAAASAPSVAASGTPHLLASFSSSTTVSGLSRCLSGPQRLHPACTSHLWQQQQQQGLGTAPCLSARALLGAQQLQQIRGMSTPAVSKRGGTRQLLLNALRKVPLLRRFLPAPPPKELTKAEKADLAHRKQADFEWASIKIMLRPFPDQRPMPPKGILTKEGRQVWWYNHFTRHRIDWSARSQARVMIPGYSLVELQVEVAKLYERVNTALAAQNVDHYKDDVTEAELEALRAQVRSMRQHHRFDRVTWELAEPIKAEDIKVVQASFMPLISHGWLHFVFKIPSRQRYAAYRKVRNPLGGSREVLVDGDPEAVQDHVDYWCLERKIFADHSMRGYLPPNSKWRLLKRVDVRQPTAAAGGGGGPSSSSSNSSGRASGNSSDSGSSAPVSDGSRARATAAAA